MRDDLSKPLLSRILSKRRITLPAPIRRHMGLVKGDQIEWEREGNDWVIFRVDPETDLPMRAKYARGTPIDAPQGQFIAWVAWPAPPEETHDE